jgi:hypothetical protein
MGIIGRFKVCASYFFDLQPGAGYQEQGFLQGKFANGAIFGYEKGH